MHQIIVEHWFLTVHPNLTPDSNKSSEEEKDTKLTKSEQLLTLLNFFGYSVPALNPEAMENSLVEETLKNWEKSDYGSLISNVLSPTLDVDNLSDIKEDSKEFAIKYFCGSIFKKLVDSRKDGSPISQQLYIIFENTCLSKKEK